MGIFGISAEDVFDAAVGIGTEFLRSRAPAPVVFGGAGPPTPAFTPSAVSPFIPAGVTPFAPVAGAAARAAGRVVTAAGTAGGISELFSLFGGDEEANGVNGVCPELYAPTPASVRPVPRIMRQNPSHPERIDVWTYAGVPKLYSGDIQTCKRVQRIARRARRARGG